MDFLKFEINPTLKNKNNKIINNNNSKDFFPFWVFTKLIIKFYKIKT